MTKRDLVYLSGPMTGIPELNYPAFNAATKHLEALGLHVFNPATLPEMASWEDYMRADVEILAKKCRALVYLNGWDNSKGAITEVYLANALNMPTISIGDELALRRLANNTFIVRGDYEVVYLNAHHPRPTAPDTKEPA